MADLYSYTYIFRYVVILSVLVISQASLACAVARSGDEYNSLLQIESRGDSSYELNFPRTVKDLTYGATAILVYYTERHNNYRPPKFEYPLKLLESGENHIASIELKPPLNHSAYVVVYWAPESFGECGAYGYTKDLS